MASTQNVGPNEQMLNVDNTVPYLVDRFQIQDWEENGSENSKTSFEKYNYYFTGQDIKIYIDGIEPPDPMAEIPMIDFAFKIEQQKTPIYGFWSYTYDQILRGTRIVQGAIRIATRTTDYMTRLVAKAAQARLQGIADIPIRKLDLDEKYIDKYWGRNIETDRVIDRNIMLIHPPFNFIIIYGIEDLSVCMPDSVTLSGSENVDEYLKAMSPITENGNNRYLLEADPTNNSVRRVIEGVEITSKQVEYNSSGQICSEVYTFIAKDEYTPDTSKANGGDTSITIPSIPEASTSNSLPPDPEVASPSHVPPNVI